MLSTSTTSETPPGFRFHPNAYDLGAFESAAGTCEACGKGRTLRYTGSFYSVDEVGYICPWCVADGTAARVFDGEFSDYAGIDGVSPDPRVPADVDLDEAMEVSTRTPSYSSWQQEQWRSHCGRPCAFIGDIGASGLTDYLDEPDFAADVDGGLGWEASLLRTHLSEGGDLAGYLFRCLTCGAHRLHVDAS
ncbi:MAG: CbrC family protein [Actinobacteria bacterium]|nr:CbrC family protein [Actinomycetota bacterium]